MNVAGDFSIRAWPGCCILRVNDLAEPTGFGAPRYKFLAGCKKI